MNMLRRNLFRSTRQRLNVILAVSVLALACCFCGGLMTFVLAPNQAIQASRLSRMPQMDAEMVNDAAAGDPILITGTLAGNEPLLETSNLIAYREERWVVTVSNNDSGDSTPSGRWQTVTPVVPELTLDVDGQTIPLLSATNVRLSGPLHDTIITSDSPTRASYEGESLPDGTQRLQGLADGDLTTVLGTKASTGGVIPEQLFLGDRVAFEENERNAASALLYSGICVMLMAPVILGGGLFYAFLGRQR